MRVTTAVSLRVSASLVPQVAADVGAGEGAAGPSTTAAVTTPTEVDTHTAADRIAVAVAARTASEAGGDNPAGLEDVAGGEGEEGRAVSNPLAPTPSLKRTITRQAQICMPTTPTLVRARRLITGTRKTTNHKVRHRPRG